MTKPESDVLQAIAELERAAARERWFEAPEAAARRGARMEVAPPPAEIAEEVNGHGVFPDAVETHYGRGQRTGHSLPSFRALIPPSSEEDDARRVREWSQRIRSIQQLQQRTHRNPDAVLLPNEYPAMEMVLGMRVHHLPIRGGYVGYRYDSDYSGMASAMCTYWTLERAGGEPWIVAGRELHFSAARSGCLFLGPDVLFTQDAAVTSICGWVPRHFSELYTMRVIDLPSASDVFVGCSMTLPLITDMERELQRQRDSSA